MKYRSQAPCAEWADTLAQALRPGELSVLERAAFQEHMAACVACATTFADYQDLVTRLRALPRPAASSQVFPELFVVQGSQKREHNLNESGVIEEQKVQGTGDPELPIPLFQPRKKPWQRRVMALAAVLLVGALIGAFALASTRSVQTGSGASVFKLAHGWTQVALYRGTGSQTITVKNLQLPQLWGYSYACQGSGNLAIKITGHASTVDTGTDKCDSTSATAPMALYMDFSTINLQKIQVTADAFTVWYLQFAEEEVQSVLPLDTSVWVSSGGVGGGWNSQPQMIVDSVPPLYNNGGQRITPKIWAILLVCVGTGPGTVQFSPDTGTINFPVCNGQPKLSLVRYPTATQVQEVTATVSGNIVWEALLLGCTSTDSAACK